MVEQILQTLKKLNIQKYSIFEQKRESVELFYIKKVRDLNRRKEVLEALVTIYDDHEKNGVKYTGVSSTYIFPDYTEERVTKELSEAAFLAGRMDNPFFELAKGDTGTENESPADLYELAQKGADELFSADNDDTAFVNSAEFFANRKTVRIVTSNGANAEYMKQELCGEFVVQSRRNGKDVELYNSFSTKASDRTDLKKLCETALKDVKNRADAIYAGDIDLSGVDIILTGKTVGELLDFYLERGKSDLIKPGYSPYKEGYNAQNNAKGELLKLDFSSTVPFSQTGKRLGSKPFIKDGKVMNIHGSDRTMYYLTGEPLGEYDGFVCDNGSVDNEELYSGNYLLVKYFSDFQMDSLSGSFGGEIRLAFLVRDGKTTVITGGSINENIIEAQKNMLFSKEKYTDNRVCVPMSVRIVKG